MTEDDILPTEPAATSAAPAESEQSEATEKAVSTEQPEAKTEQDPEAEPNADEADGDDEDRPRKPSRYQRLKRERDALAARIAQMESRPMAAAAGDQNQIDALVRKEIGDAPKESDFTDWFDYQNAKAAYETEKRIVARDIKRRVEDAQATQQTYAQQLVTDHQDRQREARAAIPDYDKIIASGADIQVSPVLEQLILESESSALLQYHLTKDRSELRRLSAMSPLEAAKAIGRLEGKLSLPNPKTATKAAPPINAPKGGASGPVDLSKLSMDEYVALRSKGAA